MRRLHVTGLRERFVASGVYTQADGLRENWSAHEVGAGALFVRVDRDGRASGGGSLLQEALRNAEGYFERIDQQLYGAGGNPGARLRCTRFGDHVALSLEDGQRQKEERIDMEPDYLMVAPGVFLGGMALAQALRMQQPVALLRMSLQADCLVWQRGSAMARCAAPEMIVTGGRERSARCCSWSDAAWAGWLDAHDVALRCETEAQTLQLTQYARRHD